MVGFILVGVALVALLILVAYTYRHPGPSQDRPSIPPGPSEGEGW